MGNSCAKILVCDLCDGVSAQKIKASQALRKSIVSIKNGERFVSKEAASMRSKTKTSPWNGRRMKQLCVALDPETIAEIDAAAKSKKTTRSEMVRSFIEWGLENG